MTSINTTHNLLEALLAPAFSRIYPRILPNLFATHLERELRVPRSFGDILFSNLQAVSPAYTDSFCHIHAHDLSHIYRRGPAVNWNSIMSRILFVVRLEVSLAGTVSFRM